MSFTEHISIVSLGFLAQSVDFTPTEKEFVNWVDSQPLPVRPLLYLAGLAKCWAGKSPSFQAWVLNARGICFADYMEKRLSPTNYLRWVGMFAVRLEN